MSSHRWLSGTIRKSRGAELVTMLPVSPVNKAESVSCSFIGTVCCEHVPSPCSLHLKAFQALRIVFCHNNGLVVYPRGSSDAQTYKTAPPPFLCYCCQPHKCVCREKPIIEKPPELSLKKESETIILNIVEQQMFPSPPTALCGYRFIFQYYVFAQFPNGCHGHGTWWIKQVPIRRIWASTGWAHIQYFLIYTIINATGQ